jgi:acetyltransferase-like isoleucine patch superfamily enzyme
MANPFSLIHGIWNSKRHPIMNKNKRYSEYSIGEYTYGQPRIVKWTEKATLSVGKYCSIAEGVAIILGGEHKTNWITTYPFWVAGGDFADLRDFPAHNGTKGDVIIGNDVWIGMNALILSGVTIGDGAVVGAGSVVAKDVGPYTIVAGNPATPIRKRFNEETIEKLLKIKWWDWDTARLKANMPLLISERITEFLEKNSL